MVKCFVSFFYAHPLTLLTPIYICVQGEEFGTTSDVHSLIVNWESRMEVEEMSMSAPQKKTQRGEEGGEKVKFSLTSVQSLKIRIEKKKWKLKTSQ